MMYAKPCMKTYREKINAIDDLFKLKQMYREVKYDYKHLCKTMDSECASMADLQDKGRILMERINQLESQPPSKDENHE